MYETTPAGTMLPDMRHKERQAIRSQQMLSDTPAAVPGYKAQEAEGYP
jgi:hypothetical protein